MVHLALLLFVHFIDEPALDDRLVLQLLVLRFHTAYAEAAVVHAVLQLAFTAPHAVITADVLDPGDGVA